MLYSKMRHHPSEFLTLMLSLTLKNKMSVELACYNVYPCVACALGFTVVMLEDLYLLWNSFVPTSERGQTPLVHVT